MDGGTTARHRVVIVGGGFGGLHCARGLGRAPVDVTLIDRRNFHLFQPLLYQVATGGLSPANIASPLRSILNDQPHTRVILGEVADFDLGANAVVLADGDRVPFDTLVLAAGSTHHYFGKDAEWEPIAPGLKTIEDATEIRRKVLSAFERAEEDPDPAARDRLLTFVVVGGGPTGVEMAGAISELARHTLRRDFRVIDPAAARVIVVEGQNRVLPTFHEKLSRKAGAALAAMGVELVFDSRVTGIEPDHVVVTSDKTKATRRIDTETVIWAAGVKASRLGKKLAERIGERTGRDATPAGRPPAEPGPGSWEPAAGGAPPPAHPGIETDRAGRVTVAADCSVPGFPTVFVIGDMATLKGPDGKPLPGVAPVAMQQGDYIAGVIARRVRGESPPAPFRYWDKGSMATIGRSRAVADAFGLQFNGWLAWAAWLFIHILYLARFENRVLVLSQWVFNYLTRNRAARLITGTHAADEFTLGPGPTAPPTGVRHSAVAERVPAKA